MAKNAIPCRQFSGKSSSFRLVREGNVITVIHQETMGRTEYAYPTNAAARRVMNNPGLIVK